MTAPIRLGLFGADGEMGRRVRACLPDFPALELLRAVDQGSPAGQRFDGCDVVVDFAVAAATEDLLARLAGTPAALVSGVTGRDAAQRGAIDARAKVAAVLEAPNFSVGVAALRRLVAEAVRLLGPGWDAEVFELHHRRKADAPSGTALALGADAAGAAGFVWPDGRRCRDGATGPRGVAEIGTAALRGGDVPGEHTVFLLGQGERIELTHRAGNRSIFARGALRAAAWLAGRPAGRYGLADALGSSKESP